MTEILKELKGRGCFTVVGGPWVSVQEKGSVKSNATARRKVTSGATAAKTPLKTDEPKVERVTKQERVHTAEPTRGGQHRRDDAGDRLAAAQRGGFLAGTVKRKLGFPLTSIEAQRQRSPLSHRNAARSLTWTKRRSISQRRSCGSRS